MFMIINCNNFKRNKLIIRKYVYITDVDNLNAHRHTNQITTQANLHKQ